MNIDNQGAALQLDPTGSNTTCQGFQPRESGRRRSLRASQAKEGALWLGFAGDAAIQPLVLASLERPAEAENLGLVFFRQTVGLLSCCPAIVTSQNDTQEGCVIGSARLKSRVHRVCLCATEPDLGMRKTAARYRS